MMLLGKIILTVDLLLSLRLFNRLMICFQQTFASVFLYHTFARSCLIFSVRAWGTARLCYWASTVLNVPRAGGGGSCGCYWDWGRLTYDINQNIGVEQKTVNVVVPLPFQKVSQYGIGKNFPNRTVRPLEPMQLFEQQGASRVRSPRSSHRLL